MTREPVLSAQAIAAAVSAVIMLGLGMAVSLGWLSLNSDQMGSIEKFVGALLALAVLVGPQLVAAFWARKQVTPLASPKLNGHPAAIVPLAAAQAMGFALPAGQEGKR
jgi:hypothetical protein